MVQALVYKWKDLKPHQQQQTCDIRREERFLKGLILMFEGY